MSQQMIMLMMHIAGYENVTECCSFIFIEKFVNEIVKVYTSYNIFCYNINVCLFEETGSDCQSFFTVRIGSNRFANQE